MAHDIFICHAHVDYNTALAACAKLEEAGVRCWIAPRDVNAGPYARQLVRAITSASAVLLVFSNHTNASEHILRELEIASKHQRVIVPFRIEDVPPNEDLEYFTLRVHWLDALRPPMDARLAELVAFMKRLLAAGPAPSAPAGPATTPAHVPIEPDATPAPDLVEAEKREAEPVAKAPPAIQPIAVSLPSAQQLTTWLKTPVGVIGTALAAAVVVMLIAFATRLPSRVPFPTRTFAPISGGYPTAFPFLLDRSVQNCPMDRAIVAEDFTHGASQWSRLPTDVTIARGFLDMRPPKGHFAYLFHDGSFHADAIICARVDAFGPDVPPTSGDTTAGIIFWDYTVPNIGDDYYAFQVNYLGDFITLHRNHNGWTLISGPTHSTAIRMQAGADNVLAVRTVGHTALLYVNGIKVDTVDGNPPTNGWWAGIIGGLAKNEDRNATWAFNAYGVALNTGR